MCLNNSQSLHMSQVLQDHMHYLLAISLCPRHLSLTVGNCWMCTYMLTAPTPFSLSLSCTGQMATNDRNFWDSGRRYSQCTCHTMVSLGFVIEAITLLLQKEFFTQRERQKPGMHVTLKSCLSACRQK